MSVQKLKDEAARALGRKDVKYLIGYKKGSYGFRVSPAFIEPKEDIEQLIISPLCNMSLVKYVMMEETLPGLTEQAMKPSKIAIVARGCDSRAINLLIEEKGVPRDRLYIIGVSCKGVIDQRKIEALFPQVTEPAEVTEENGNYIISFQGESHTVPKEELLAELCKVCQYPTPLIYKLPARPADYDDIATFEALPVEERLAYWQQQFSKCVRCYACRNVCPLCYSTICSLDSLSPQWLRRSVDTSENFMFQIIRTFHLAGRCIGCGECERVCPMNLPLMKLNRKLEKAAKELFSYESGKDPKAKSLLTTFHTEDPQGFIL
jgi:ferredoxin